jgi:hypothetical protein
LVPGCNEVAQERRERGKPTQTASTTLSFFFALPGIFIVIKLYFLWYSGESEITVDNGVLEGRARVGHHTIGQSPAKERIETW